MNCGTENADQNTYCAACGKSLDRTTVQSNQEVIIDSEIVQDSQYAPSVVPTYYDSQMNDHPEPPINQVQKDYTTVCTLALVLGIVAFLINPIYLVSLAALILGIIGHVNNGSKKNLAIAGWILAIVSFFTQLLVDLFCTLGAGIFC